MKKLFSFALGLFAMTTLQAANTEVARLTLTGQGGTESSNVTLRVDPSISAPVTTSFFGATDEVGQVNIYVAVGADKYAQYKENAIANLDLQVITNRRAAADQHYTLTFNVPTSTNGLTLKDLATGTVTDITHNGTYEFDVNTTLHPDYVEGTNYTIKNRFVINYDPSLFVASVTTNEDGWASFTDQVAGRDVAPVYPAGLKVYKGKVNGTDPNNIVFDLSQVNAIYWGEGVFVKGAPLTTYYFAEATADMDDFVDNEIIGCAEAKSVEDIRIGGQYEIYALRHEGDSPTALYQYVGTDDIPAGKAVMRIHWDDYLIVPGSPAPRRITVRVNETEETQAVENVQSDNVQCIKFIENGEVLIRRGEAVYNLQGQMVK